MMMTNTTHTKMVTTAVKRTRSRGSAATLIPRELIAHQVGGHLALDFRNTTGEHLTERPDELMRDWESFLRWVAQVLIESHSYFELLRHPEPLLPIVQLSEAIYRVGLAAAGTSRISEHDLALIRENANAAWAQDGASQQRTPVAAHSVACGGELCAVLAGEAPSVLSYSLKAARFGICEGVCAGGCSSMGAAASDGDGAT